MLRLPHHQKLSLFPHSDTAPQTGMERAGRLETSIWIRLLYADTLRDLGDHSSMQLPQIQLRPCCTHLFAWPWPHFGRASSMEARRAASMGWICPKGLRPLKSSKPTAKFGRLVTACVTHAAGQDARGC